MYPLRYRSQDWTGTPGFAAAYPVDLSAEGANGTRTLRVLDDSPGYVGVFENWSLTV